MNIWRVLFQNPKLLSNLNEGCNGLVKVRPLVCGRKLHADTGLPLRDYGIVEAGHENTFFSHSGREFLGKRCIIEHNCTDGTLGGLDVKARGHHLLTEVNHVLH